MPDWQKHVRRNLAPRRCGPENWEEISAELAAHLEEAFEACRCEGLSELQAVERTLERVPDWRDLQQRIRRAKNGGPTMEERCYRLWIPGFAGFALSTTVLLAVENRAFPPRIDALSGQYVWWLLSLPCWGALAASLSSRAGASRCTALLASLFPVLGLAAALPIGLFMEWVTGWPADFRDVAAVFLKAPVGSLLVPGVALLLGGLPVELFLSRGVTPPKSAIS
jgi:hypothetical protein